MSKTSKKKANYKMVDLEDIVIVLDNIKWDKTDCLECERGVSLPKKIELTAAFLYDQLLDDHIRFLEEENCVDIENTTIKVRVKI